MGNTWQGWGRRCGDVTGYRLGAEGGKAVALALGKVLNVTSLDLSGAY